MSVTINRNQAALGSTVMGSSPMNTAISTSVTTPTGEVTGRRRATYGFEYFGHRVYSKSFGYAPYTRSNVGGGGFASITISNYAGALLGQIRTDIKNTIVKELSFTLDEKGCAEFNLTLNSLPSFPLLPVSIVRINIANDDFDWYCGQLEYAPDEGTFRSEYKYKGFGLRKLLERVSVERTYSAPQDIGLIVQDIAQNYIATQTPIGYNASKIETTTGVLIASDNELSKAKMDKVLDTYAEMASARWGVDGDGDLYFELKSNTIKRNYFIGYEFTEFEPEQNTNDIKNSIYVQRQDGKGSGGAGWAVAYIAQDTTSQAKYGVRELQYQMPGYFSDADCTVVGDALLAELKDPKTYAKISNIPVLSVDSYLERGVTRFINQPSRWISEVQDCDDYTDWTIDSGTGDIIVLSDSSSILLSGAASLKATWTANSFASWYSTISVTGGIKKVQAWVRANRAGSLVQIGVGNGSYIQNQKTIPIPVQNTWVLFDWDVSDLNLTDLNQVGFDILNADETTTLYIDRIMVELVGSKHYSLEMTKATYTFGPGKQMISSAEFGPPPMRMYDYVASLLAQAAENKFTGEQR